MTISFDFSDLKILVNENSHTHNKSGVDRNGEIFREWMSELGFKCQRHPRQNIGDHLLFTSARHDGRRLLLLGHLDTVFPPGAFSEFREDSSWVYGPGVCDMKGGNCIALAALRQLKQLCGEITNIDMLLVSDEETGSDDSRSLTSELAKNYDACLVFEAAGENGEVVIGRKGVATITITLTGRAAHAGNRYSEGVNSNLAAAHMLIELQSLTDLDNGSTVNVGKITGGIGANTISPMAQLVVEARYTSISERDRLLTAIHYIAEHPKVEGIEVDIEGGVQRDVMEPNATQKALLNELETILGESLKTERRGGVSDANIVAAAGVPTLDGFGPFGDGDHTIHERACKKSFDQRLAQVSKILLAFHKAIINTEEPQYKEVAL